jgi:hypothetical protein
MDTSRLLGHPMRRGLDSQPGVQERGQYSQKRERHINLYIQLFSENNTVQSAELVFKFWSSGNVCGVRSVRRDGIIVREVSCL